MLTTPFHYLTSLVALAPSLIVRHPGWTFVVGVAMAVVGGAVILHRALPPVAEVEGAVRGSDGQLHAVWAGYDGEGVYAWSCFCGDGVSDFQSKDFAAEEAAHHLLDVEAMVSA